MRLEPRRRRQGPGPLPRPRALGGRSKLTDAAVLQSASGWRLAMTIVSTLLLIACARTCCGPGRRLNGERTLLGAEDSKNKKETSLAS